MQATCSRCRKMLEFSGEPPKFCAYCGQDLSAGTVEFVLASNTPGQTPLPGATTGTITLPPAPGQAVPEQAPRTVGGFKILRRLGGGGMGSVFEAEDSRSGRHVAVKLVLPEYAGSTETVRRFRQEGKLASSLAHPRCVFVLAADEEAGQPYIVMELMPGATLEDLVREKGPLSPEEAIAKILDVIDGLREAHRLGLVHRDVKPSNCFLEADGRVKVGDFGLARSLVSDSRLTRTGTFIGTPLFTSPEQIKMEPVDAQSDLYSVAATLYFLLAGKAPFQGGDMMATMARIVVDEPPPLRGLRPELSKALEKVVLRGLARERKRRYRDLDELRRALHAFLPARPSVVGSGLRFAAYLLDSLILSVVGLAAGLVIALLFRVGVDTAMDRMVWDDWTVGLHSKPALWVTQTVISLVIFFLYYGMLEGRSGWTLGKRLLRLRVGRAAENHPPGVGRAMLRFSILYILFNAGNITLVAVLAASDLLDKGQNVSEQESMFIGLLGLANGLWIMIAAALIISTMRRHNGFRGLHEVLSGTRTYRLHWPQPQKRRILQQRPFHLEITQPAGLPAQVGAFRVLGALRWTERERTLLAEDPRLGRPLWLWLRPAGEPALDTARREISRATRIRWVGCGVQEGWQWDAFLAPAGMPLPALAVGEPRLTWAEVRPILEDLTEELTASCTEGTLPHSLSVHQVWVQPNGPIQLLGTPLRGIADHVQANGSSDPGSEAEQAIHETSCSQRALDFLRRVAFTALEGSDAAEPAAILPSLTLQARQDCSPPRAPLPVHASEMLAHLFAAGEPDSIWQRWQNDLEATGDRPTEITRLRRAGHLGLMTLLLLIPLAMLSLITFFLALPANACLGLEKVDMLSFLGVTEQIPTEEAACPPVYCITPLVWLATGMSAKSSREAR